MLNNLRVRISEFFDLQGDLPNRTRLVSCYFDVFTPEAADEIAVETVVFKGQPSGDCETLVPENSRRV